VVARTLFSRGECGQPVALKKSLERSCRRGRVAALFCAKPVWELSPPLRLIKRLRPQVRRLRGPVSTARASGRGAHHERVGALLVAVPSSGDRIFRPCFGSPVVEMARAAPPARTLGRPLCGHRVHPLPWACQRSDRDEFQPGSAVSTSRTQYDVPAGMASSLKS
jgi:hypothetical protein